MTLHDFERTIDEKILSRGWDYYDQELVSRIEQVGQNEFCAIVVGSEHYNVFVKLDGQQKILEHSCDCPYDWSDVCKHKVATFFQIKEHQLYNQPIKKSSIHQIKEDLDKLTKDEIVEMIVELSKRNNIVREQILWDLGYE